MQKKSLISLSEHFFTMEMSANGWQSLQAGLDVFGTGMMILKQAGQVRTTE